MDLGRDKQRTLLNIVPRDMRENRACSPSRVADDDEFNVQGEGESESEDPHSLAAETSTS